MAGASMHRFVCLCRALERGATIGTGEGVEASCGGVWAFGSVLSSLQATSGARVKNEEA
jgi:hypothetical protein